MKHILCFLLLTVSILQAQVGIGTTSPAATSVLDLTSTTKGFLVPRMTATQIGNISSPATGLLIYQTDGTAGFYYYSGGWILLTNNLITKVGGTNFTNSMLIGHETTGSLNAAEQNTGVGFETLQALTSGDGNTAFGFQALKGQKASIENTAIGGLSLFQNSSTDSYGNGNTGVGFGTLYTNTSGSYNVAIGIEL